MRVKVVEPFKDKKTGKLHDTKGESSTFECTEARYKEIKKYVSVVEETKTEPKAEKQ